MTTREGLLDLGDIIVSRRLTGVRDRTGKLAAIEANLLSNEALGVVHDEIERDATEEQIEAALFDSWGAR